MIAKMRLLEEKLQDKEEEIETMKEEKDYVDKELEIVYDEYNIATVSRKNKRKNKCIDGEAKNIVGGTMKKVFHYFKFTQQRHLFRWSTREDGSYCARIRARFDRAGMLFNKIIWKCVCHITVE